MKLTKKLDGCIISIRCVGGVPSEYGTVLRGQYHHRPRSRSFGFTTIDKPDRDAVFMRDEWIRWDSGTPTTEGL